MYENIFDKYNADFVGKKLISVNNTKIGLNAPKPTSNGQHQLVFGSVDISIIVTMTGRYIQFIDNSVAFQVQYGSGYGYILADDFDNWTGYNAATAVAQNELNQLINYNKAILENNLLCVAALSMCDKAGVIVPAAFRQNLVALQNRLTKRNNDIKTSGVVINTSEGQSPDMSVYNDKLLAFIQSPGIGLVITTTSLIIAGVIALVSVAAAYLLFKRLNAEAKADYKYSDELTSELIKFLPEEVYKDLMRENKANESKAQKAIDNASGKSFFTTAKYLAVGFLGFWAIDKFLQNRK